MIYLDYSATTPPGKEVIACFEKESERYYGNPNSLHAFGEEAKARMEMASKKIKKIFGYDDCEIIYTSGATEANNMAIMGIAKKNRDRGKHIITTSEEHPSVTACFSSLAKAGYEVDVLDPKKDGTIDLEQLKSLIRPDTILVSISNVNSEIGSINDIENIGKILKEYPNVVFHSDMTQSIGKIALPSEYPDLFTFSGHKIYGLKGIGALVRKSGTMLEPILYGGASYSPYRPGTPPEPLIVSLSVALEVAYKGFAKKVEKIAFLNKMLKNGLMKIPGIVMNSPGNAINQIINFSILGIPSSVMQKKLSDREIYVSTQSACCFDKTYSRLVRLLYNDMERAESSIRVSVSHLTCEKEIEAFLEAVKTEIKQC